MGGCGLILAVAVAVLPAAASAQTSPEDFALRARSVAGAIPLLRPGQFNCTIKPLRVVEVTSAITGVAARVLVRPGQQVAAGDPLVELDAAMARAELALGEARASDDSALRASILRRDGLARKEERLARGLARGAVSPADHDDAALELALAAADVERQKAALEMAALDLAKTRIAVENTLIAAPVAGMIGEDLIDPGEGTSAGPLATIYVNQPLRVEAFVPSSALPDFVAAARHDIVVNDDVAHPLPVRFDYAAQLADLASGTISVFFTLDAPEVLPGSKCLIAGLPEAGSALPGSGPQNDEGTRYDN